MPLPPNRTGGFPAYGSPVSGSHGEHWPLALGSRLRRLTQVRRSRHWAIVDGRPDCFRRRVDETAFAASRAGDLAAVKAAVQNGAALETKTPYGQTPLYLAAMNGHEEVVRFLLEKGASTDVKDTFYKAPMLGFVLQRKHWGVARLLVSQSSNPDQNLADQNLGDVAGAAKHLRKAAGSAEPAVREDALQLLRQMPAGR